MTDGKGREDVCVARPYRMCKILTQGGGWEKQHWWWVAAERVIK